MLFTTVGQGWVFAWMMAAGALIGAWYAALAALRRLLRAGFWLSLITDLAFGAGAAVIYCAALVAADWGRFRLYSALGTLLGFALFAWGVFPPARRAAARLASAFRHIFATICGFRWIKVIFR